MRCAGGSEESGTSCLRCRRQNIPCVYSAPFHRVHKRKRMQELKEEASALRRELQDATPSTLGGRAKNDEPTDARSIDGLELSSAIIDHCFEIFFRDYHPLLPILDPTTTPNSLYVKSQVLFCVVVSIGARKNSAHPNLITALSARVSPLVLGSLNTRTRPLEAIKAMLLLMEWPFPSNSYQYESSFVLSGALVHMAMQNGLHVPYLSKETPKLEAHCSFVESTALERARLWAYVVIVYQRSCSGCGYPPILSVDAYTEQEQFKAILLQLPADLQLQLQLANILVRVQKSFIQFGTQKLAALSEQGLDSVLRMASGQFDSLELTASSSRYHLVPKLFPRNQTNNRMDWERFHVAICRLEVLAMHFFRPWESIDAQTCQSIFDTALYVFAFIQEQETNHRLSRFCPRFVFSALKMGQALMFRLLKGPFASYVDEQLGSTKSRAMIPFMKSVSLEDGDKVHREVTIVEQMWDIDNVFKDADGNWNVALRIKHRLSASVVHEIAIRWREKRLDVERPDGFRQDKATVDSSQVLSNNEQNNRMDFIDTDAFTDPLGGFLKEFDLDLGDFFDSQFVQY